MPESEDERYVRELLASEFGVELSKVPEGKTKTFDYSLMAAGVRVAAVEVKRLGPVPMTLENGWVRTEGGMMTRRDNAPSRVADAIHAAHKQLVTAMEAKVLVFVNDAHGVDALDLEEALNGYLVYGNDTVGRYKNPTGMSTNAQTRICEEKFGIDLYTWINRYEGRTVVRLDGQPLEPHARRGPFFKVTSDAGYDLATRYFKVPETPKPTADPDADVPTLGEMLMRQAGIRR